MKVSKKCVQKMKNRRFLLGKIGRIWVLAFCASLFLCSLGLGTSASAFSGAIYPSSISYHTTTNSTDIPIDFGTTNVSPFISLGANTGINDLNLLVTSGSRKAGQKFYISFSIRCRVPLFSSGSTIQSDPGMCSSGGPTSHTSSLAFTNVDISPVSSDYQSYYYGSDNGTISNSYLYDYNIVIYGYLTVDISPSNSSPFNFDLGGPIILHNSASAYVSFTKPLIVYYDETDAAADAINQQSEEEKSETNSKVDEGNTASNSSSSEASAQGSTLLSAFQSFIGALTSASPSNCNINMDLGNLDLGNANLCSISPPPAFQVISSIVLIGFCVPLSIATAKKLISLFRSFQS